jgi:hypothetical protein
MFDPELDNFKSEIDLRAYAGAWAMCGYRFKLRAKDPSTANGDSQLCASVFLENGGRGGKRPLPVRQLPRALSRCAAARR